MAMTEDAPRFWGPRRMDRDGGRKLASRMSGIAWTRGALELLSPFPCCPLSRSVGGKAVLSLHCMIWPALICHWAPPPMREFFSSLSLVMP